MGEQRLDAFFWAHGFRNVKVNANGLRVYRFQSKGSDIYDDAGGGKEENLDCFVIVYFCERFPWTREQQENIARQVCEKYGSGNNTPVDLLSIAVTDKPQEARKLFWGSGRHWILDTHDRRLMLYEEEGDFYGLKDPLEEALYSGRILQDTDGWNQQNRYLKSQNDTTFHAKPIACNIAIVVINILVFLVFEIFGNSEEMWTLYRRGALQAERVVENYEYYRLFTYMFLHSGIDHLVNNMLILWFLGNHLEKRAGHVRFLLLYFATGIIAGVASMSYNISIGRHAICVGASGAIFGVVGAVIMDILLQSGKVEELTTRKMLLFLVLSLYGGFTSQGVDNIAHIGGLAAGMLLGLVCLWGCTSKDGTYRTAGEEEDKF